MHQELQLVPELTVAENVFLGLEEHRWGVLRRTEARRLEELMAASGFRLDPNAIVARLPIADQQKIEILRALAREARIIVMDEPTSSLSRDEVSQLHVAMRKLRDEGRSIIYVSHFLNDILEVADRITVLRDGEHVKTAPAAGETRSTLVAAMLGGGKERDAVPAENAARGSGARPPGVGPREPARAPTGRASPSGAARSSDSPASSEAGAARLPAPSSGRIRRPAATSGCGASRIGSDPSGAPRPSGW